jgi:DNA-binding NarL/FixJ family response regulator
MRKARLVFIDRNELTRALFGYVLEGSAGIDIVGEAADLDSAMPLIRQLVPDAVVTGYELPLREKSRLRSGLRAEFPRMRILELSELDEAVSRKISCAAEGERLRFQYSEMVH